MILAELTAADLAVVTAIVVSMAAVAVLTVVSLSLLRTVRTLRAELVEFRTRSDAALAELHDTVAEARTDLDRVDDLIGSAEALAATVDGAARVGYFTVGKPVIKTVALAKGTSRAARRMRNPRAG